MPPCLPCLLVSPTCACMFDFPPPFGPFHSLSTFPLTFIRGSLSWSRLPGFCLVACVFSNLLRFLFFYFHFPIFLFVFFPFLSSWYHIFPSLFPCIVFPLLFPFLLLFPNFFGGLAFSVFFYILLLLVSLKRTLFFVTNLGTAFHLTGFRVAWGGK